MKTSEHLRTTVTVQTMEDFRLSIGDFMFMLTEREERLIILDMRSFLAFTKEHLEDAINVGVPSVLLRRIEFTCGVISQGIGRPHERKIWENRAGAVIVLYDQTTKTTQDHAYAYKLLQALKAENAVKAAYWLQDGFAGFQGEYPELCVTPSIDAARQAITAKSSVVDEKGVGPVEPTEIEPGIFLGGELVAGNEELLKKYNITAAVNCACEFEYRFAGIVYLNLGMADNPGQQNLEETIENALAFIKKMRNSGQRVLVHCRAAQSRSVLVILAYLMREKGWTQVQAYEYTQKLRPNISPNLGFMGFLMRYSHNLRMTSESVTISTPTRVASPVHRVERTASA